MVASLVVALGTNPKDVDYDILVWLMVAIHLVSLVSTVVRVARLRSDYFLSGWTQVGSLSSSKVSRQLLMNDLNQVSSISLLMTASTALANKGLFELTRRPSLARVSLSFEEINEEPGCCQVKRPKF